MLNKLSEKWLLISIEISLIIIIFLFLTVYFNTHFYPGTVIDGVNVSFKTARIADKELNKRASFYELTLIERGDIKETIKGADFGLKFDLKNGSISLKMKQNKTLWLLSYFNKSAVHFNNNFTFDKKLLKEQLSKLNCMDPLKEIEPRNAALVYSDGAYKVVDEVDGNKLNSSKLFFGIKNAVANGVTEMDLKKLNCYVNPEIRSDSEKVRNTKAVAEKYLTSRIIYTYEDGREIVDEAEISKWLEFDENLTIIFNKKKMKVFLNTLAVHYNTCGTTRDFVTSSGTRIKVGGGDYGWMMDINGETEDLIEAVESGNTIFKEPTYSQKGAIQDLNDIGHTYVEIDLTKQHLWYYKDGALITHGDVVTGKMNNDYKTPEGIYILKFKVRNAILRGEGYQVKVSYWMPFNNNIGIHDAFWRTTFGGSINLTRGSHGCVNAPYKLAETLYNNITVGTPVICYY